MPPLTPQNFDDLLITSVAVRQDVRTAKVLIVDRDPEFVESLRRVVGEAGYPTVGAHTAIEALATVKSEGCQIVILDRDAWAGWLDPSVPAASLIRPLPAGTLLVEKVG